MTTTQMIELAYKHCIANFSEDEQTKLLAAYSNEELGLYESDGVELVDTILGLKFYSDKNDDTEYNNFLTWYYINYALNQKQ